MDTKICRTCGEEHSLDMFNRNKKHKDPNYRIPDCNTCRSRKRREVFRKNKALAIEYKGGSCNDCNTVVHQAAFEFHHLDPTQKDIDPAHLIGEHIRGLTDKAKVELDKCILLCANCHRVRHFIID
jgi:hypothetical protein